MLLYGSIDPTASEKRWSACALLDDEPSLQALGRPHSDAEIIRFFPKTVWAVGLDAPCSLPLGLKPCCLKEHPTCGCRSIHPWKGRTCERDLVRAGFRVFYPSRNAFAKGWLRRGLRLKKSLGVAGLRVLEIYPNASKRRLFGQLPPKATQQGRQTLQRLLGQLIQDIPGRLERLFSHHELDAILGAYTVFLHHHGLTEEVGDPEEGVVIVPRRDLMLI